MKKLLLLLLISVMILSFSGCRSVSESKMEQTLSQFTDALKLYDRDAMTALLTEFPDNTNYIYLDDIFNDEPYMKLYRKVFPSMSYKVKKADGDQLTVEVTMANIQKLYTDVTTMVLGMVMEDASLQEKLEENDENGIILIQELMLALVNEGNFETMKAEYTLTFTEKGESALLVCDDQLRAFVTGNFFLSKNITRDQIEET